MRLIDVETLELKEFHGDNIPLYAILSHTWGAVKDEVSFHDIETGKIEKSGIGLMKLKGCCNQAKKDGLGYAWIDTCCIDKTNSVELGEAINSMFRWYKKAVICYAYLSDVPSGDSYWDSGSKFFSSRWFRRGWTLQELLAPQELCFYDQTWATIGTKREISGEIETITGIPRRFLAGWDLHEASVAQRMSWAAKRETTREEDITYCLLGLFDVIMPMIYGEGDKAFSRLQEAIIKKTRDDSILAWGLDPAVSMPSKSTDVLSAGILASAPSDFANCGRIILRKQDDMHANPFDISGGRLRVQLSLHVTSTGDTYGLLNCGPDHDAEQVVGIPLYKVISSDEYLRPQGRYPALFSKTASSVLMEAIRIQMEHQSRTSEAMSRRYWFYIDGYKKINLKLIDDYPPNDWKKGSAMIAKANDTDENITRRYLARFRTQSEGSQDFIVLLEVEIQGLQIEPRCHVMTSSRDTTLEDFSQRLIYMRPEAFGKQTASNGNLNLKVVVKEDQVAQEPRFIVELARASSSMVATVDANLELEQIDLKLKFVRLLQDEDQVRQETERLDQQREEEMAALDQLRERLAVVQESLRKLSEEEKFLINGLEQGTQHVDLLTDRCSEARQQQHKLSAQESDIQQRLDELDTNEAPENWLEMIIKTQLDAGEIGRGAVKSEYNSNDQPALLWAVRNGHEAVVRLLIEKGADVEGKDMAGWTPLGAAIYNRQEAMVQLLIGRGANIEAKNKSGSTRLILAAYNGYEAIVRLLIEKGANIEARNKDGWTPLVAAVDGGHTAIVQLLIEKGADIEAKTNNGSTLIGLAANSGYEAIVRLLIEKGANIEAENKDGWMPLAAAVGGGHTATVQLLIDKGANIEARINDSRTPLLLATDIGHEAIVRLLIEKGANIEAENKEGRTSLLLAADIGHEAIVRLLIEKGANIDAKDKDGWMPLAAAVYGGYMAVVQLLINEGADIEAKTNHGRTPLVLARDTGHQTIAHLLIKEGADVEAKTDNTFNPAIYGGQTVVRPPLIEKSSKKGLRQRLFR